MSAHSVTTQTYVTNIENYKELADQYDAVFLDLEDDVITATIFLYNMNSNWGDEDLYALEIVQYNDGSYAVTEMGDEPPDRVVMVVKVTIRAAQHRM